MGWYNGFGFSCVEDPENGTLTSFYEYATSGQEMDDPIPQPENLDGTYSQTTMISVIAGVMTIVFVIIIVNVVYRQVYF